MWIKISNQNIKITVSNWKNTIHGSKYFSVNVSDGKNEETIDFRFSDHFSNGTSFNPSIDNYTDIVEVLPGLYYSVGSFRFYSISLAKNQKHINKAVNSPIVVNDMVDYIKIDYPDFGEQHDLD